MFGAQWKVPMFGAQWKVKEKHIFTSSHFPTKKFYLRLHFFLWSWGFTLPCSRSLFTHSLPFPWLINYNCASRCNKYFTPSLSIWFWLKVYFPLLEIMASRMATSYGPQVAHVNEEPALMSF
jgi:hypothetical protein